MYDVSERIGSCPVPECRMQLVGSAEEGGRKTAGPLHICLINSSIDERLCPEPRPLNAYLSCLSLSLSVSSPCVRPSKNQRCTQSRRAGDGQAGRGKVTTCCDAARLRGCDGATRPCLPLPACVWMQPASQLGRAQAQRLSRVPD